MVAFELLRAGGRLVKPASRQNGRMIYVGFVLVELETALDHLQQTVITRPTIAFFISSRRPGRHLHDYFQGGFWHEQLSNFALIASSADRVRESESLRTVPVRCHGLKSFQVGNLIRLAYSQANRRLRAVTASAMMIPVRQRRHAFFDGLRETERARVRRRQ